MENQGQQNVAKTAREVVQALKPRKRNRHQEGDLQAAVIKWWDYAHKGLGVSDKEYLFAVPNQGRAGGKSQAIRGAIMKAQGLRAGVSDLLLLVPRRGYHGLAIELKRSENERPTDAQIHFLTLLQAQGYCTALRCSFAQTTGLITWYLSLE